mgnify:CR=1 FL=1
MNALGRLMDHQARLADARQITSPAVRALMEQELALARVPLTAGGSIAVDPRHIPLGTPVLLSATLPGSDKPLNRLVVAQDTGGAIRGPIRADYFWGLGPEAGRQAGLMKQQGRLWLLWPVDLPLPDGAS